MDKLLYCVADYEKESRAKLSQHDWGYYAAGSVGEETLTENCQAYKRWRFRPRILRNVANVDISTTILGSKISFPICIAPSAYHGLCTPDGEISTAKAADSLGVGMTLSLWSNKTMEGIAIEVPNCIRWCHIQVVRNREMTKHYVRRAERHGFTGFIVTIDENVLVKRHYRYSNGNGYNFSTTLASKNIGDSIKLWEPNKPANEVFNDYLDGTSDWEEIDWLKSITQLPIVVKGILTEEMALEAIDHQVDGIIVSNHGGRLYDGSFATIDALPEVVKAVNGRCDVYLDGGIRKGTDVAKAIALGAKAVFVGRPILWGLACKGQEGVKNVLEILREELVKTMQFIGVKSIKELQTTPKLVVHETRHFAKL
uniref:hydroxyacid oxidase 1-like n=1 Tax=Styela clava TaxID=7725 RepID=UPI0019392B91|nr:hydroxyacid oxidase 1-like [Styela clava]